MNIGDAAIPIIIAFVFLTALIRRVDLFEEFVEGVKDGLKTVLDIFPALFALVVSIGMLRSSGAVNLLISLISPLTSLVGFPDECIPLLVLRPFSGSGSIAIFEDILTQCGADSFAGQIASVMLGSSETTFYTLAVYFSGAKIKKIRYALLAALTGDLLGWIFSVFAVKMVLG